MIEKVQNSKGLQTEIRNPLLFAMGVGVKHTEEACVLRSRQENYMAIVEPSYTAPYAVLAALNGHVIF